MQRGFAQHPEQESSNPRVSPGGHVEPDESPAEVAVRETAEELGCRVQLLPGPSVPLPERYPHPRMAPPWWIVKMAASSDNHTAVRHLHLDHVFVGLYVADDQPPESRVCWAGEQELAQAPGIPEDVRLPAKELFAEVARLTGRRLARRAVPAQEHHRFGSRRGGG